MSKVKICLDAGHYGSSYNHSPVVGSYYESAMAWDLHLKLKAELEARGFEVVTTRASRDRDLAVYSRGAASRGCDLFLSLHSNACGTESVDYPVVYRAYDNLNGIDTLALKTAERIGELMGTRQAGRTAIRKNSSGGEYYGVLRGARAVGTPLYMLVEHSFHTNTAAAQWLSVDANLDLLAAAEADLLAEHFGIRPVPEGKTQIMGQARATVRQMALFCRSKNAAPQLPGCSLEQLCQMFLEEGAAEGVRGDVAFAQSLHETGYFRYGGIVQPSQNNYAGIGALNGNGKGQAATFPDHGGPGPDPALKGLCFQGTPGRRVCGSPLFSGVPGLCPLRGVAGGSGQPGRQGLGGPRKGLWQEDHCHAGPDPGVAGAGISGRRPGWNGEAGRRGRTGLAGRGPESPGRCRCGRQSRLLGGKIRGGNDRR